MAGLTLYGMCINDCYGQNPDGSSEMNFIATLPPPWYYEALGPGLNELG